MLSGWCCELMWWGGPSSLVFISWMVWWNCRVESELICSFAPVPCPYKRGLKVALSFLPFSNGVFRISSFASINGVYIWCALPSHLSNDSILFWIRTFWVWGHLSSGLPPLMLQCYFARLNTMYVYSFLVPQWPVVDQQFLQPGVTGASDCEKLTCP